MMPFIGDLDSRLIFKKVRQITEAWMAAIFVGQHRRTGFNRPANIEIRVVP